MSWLLSPHLSAFRDPEAKSQSDHLPYIAVSVAQLRAIGEDAPDDLLAHTSPAGWGQIAFSGGFLWDGAAAMPTGRRSLNLGRMSIAV